MGFARKYDTLTSESLRHPWIIELYALGLVLKPWRPSHQEPRPKRYDAPTSKSSDRSVLLTGYPSLTTCTCAIYGHGRSFKDAPFLSSLVILATCTNVHLLELCDCLRHFVHPKPHGECRSSGSSSNYMTPDRYYTYFFAT